MLCELRIHKNGRIQDFRSRTGKNSETSYSEAAFLPNLQLLGSRTGRRAIMSSSILLFLLVGKVSLSEDLIRFDKKNVKK